MRNRAMSMLAVLAIVLASVWLIPAPTPAGAQGAGSFYREAVLDDANVVTDDEATTGTRGWAEADLAAFTLSCTEDSGTATLDVAIQRSVNGGVSWADIVAFTQLSAAGGQTSLYADVRAASAQMIGDYLRVDYDVTGTGQYTCTVYAAAEG